MKKFLACSPTNLKNRLSSYLRKVRAGETVLILERGVPIARIERVGAGAANDRMARLEAAGLIRRPSKPLSMKQLATGLPKARASVVEALLEERERER